MNKVFTSLLIAILFLTNGDSILSQVIRTESTMNSIGYYIENASSISNHVSFEIKFKESIAPSWRNGIDPSTFTYSGGNKLFAGSILQLKAGTEYMLDITIIDSFPMLNKHNFTAKVSTKKEVNLSHSSSDILYVSPNGKGRTYSSSSPGAIDTLFNFDAKKIKCGTVILCKGGTYYVGGLNFNVTPSLCSDLSTPIIISSMPNESAVFDGSDPSQESCYPTWTLYNAAQNIYTAKLPASTAFSALFLYDNLRLFPYATIYTQQFLSLNTYYKECLTNCKTYFGSGFYRNANNYFIKLSNGENPNGKKITVSKQNYFLRISNSKTNNNPQFIVKNITLKNYGKSNVSFTILGALEYDISATALIFTNMTNTIIDHCTFEHNTSPMYFGGKSDSTIIQNCIAKDQTGAWMHGAFKNTSLTLTGDINWILDNGKYGRDLQKSFVYFEPQTNTITKNIILRNNTINGLISGGAARQSEVSPFQDIDIYNNTYINCYDAIDIIGNAANYRIWNNRISNCPIVFSLIPFEENNITYSNSGPAYFFRNIVDKSPTRANIPNSVDNINPEIYIGYNSCEGAQNKVWSTGLKMNTGPEPAEVRTDLHFYHNTMSVEDSLSFNFFLWQNTWKRIISKNNSWNSKFIVLNFESVLNQNDYGFKSINDNFFSENNKLATINGTHGDLMSCRGYNNLDSLDLNLRKITGNYDKNLLQIKGYNFNPKFVNPSNGDYHLLFSSNLIDKAEHIPNISDQININYFGAAPDIGALETNTTASSDPSSDNNSFEIYPNPVNNVLHIIIPKVETYKIQIHNIFGQQCHEVQNIGNILSTFDVSNLKSGIYFISIHDPNGKFFTKKIIKN